MALQFYPRGGSAQVARYLSRSLREQGIAVDLTVGSVGRPGTLGHAATFFGDDGSLSPIHFDEAVADWRAGRDPMDSFRPLPPSYEAREGVPDRVMTAVSKEQFSHATDMWFRHFSAARGFVEADILHIHHLSVMQLAARAAEPHLPIVTHLHGTELKLLDEIARGTPGLAHQPHVTAAVNVLRAAANESDAIVVNSPHDHSEAIRLLDIDPASTHELTNGVDVAQFAPVELTAQERRAHWRRWLVEDPRGWDAATGEPGSISYGVEALDRFVDPVTGEVNPVLLFVGRFLRFKRVPMLVRAYARARPHFERTAPLVIWGGAPGEWEGEHPHDVARELGVDDVFFVGWRGHEELPTGFACSDALVAPSVDEPFGQVYLEAMACGRAVVGTSTGGPPSFINLDAAAPDGHLVEPDEEEALAAALVALVNDPDQRRAMGINGLAHVGERFAWSAVAQRFIDVYETVAGHR